MRTESSTSFVGILIAMQSQKAVLAACFLLSSIMVSWIMPEEKCSANLSTVTFSFFLNRVFTTSVA